METIYYNPSQRKIGVYDEKTNRFGKRVRSGKHLFKKLDAWGIDASLFSQKLLPNNTRIMLLDEQENKLYTTNAATFSALGTFLHFKNKDQDHGPQVFLPRKYWTVSSFRKEVQL